MARIKMHIPKAKLPFYPPCKVKCRLQNGVSTNSKSHSLFYMVFIHRILLDLGLEDFPTSEPIHIIAPIGAIFLRQRLAQLKASSKHPRVKSSTCAASMPHFSDPTVEDYVDPIATVDPPPSSSSESSIRSMLETIMTN